MQHKWMTLFSMLVLLSLTYAHPAQARVSNQPLFASGDFLWAKNLGGSSGESIGTIDVDPNGNVYMTGDFEGTADFDPGVGTFNLSSMGARDVFIAKLNSSGDLIWAKSLGGTQYDYAFTLATDGNNVYTSGVFYGTVDFDPGPGVFNLTGTGSGDIFVSKLDKDGNFVWAKQLGSGESYGITVDASANLYITGFGSGDFDPGPGVYNLTSMGSNDIFVSKLDGNGDFVWARGIGGTGIDNGEDIVVDAGGNIYVVGDFQSTIDFDPGPGLSSLTSAGSYDAFLAKFDSSGNLLWAKNTGGASADYGFGIALDASGAVYRTGMFNGTADFDPGAGVYNMTSAGNRDVFVAKSDPDGAFIWAKQMGGPGDDHGSTVDVDGSGHVYIGGGFRETADFDPGAGTSNLTSIGLMDLFAAKLDVNGAFVWAKGTGGPADDFGLAVALDASGDVYTGGSFSGTVDFDPGPGVYNLTSGGSSDIFVSRLQNSVLFGDVPSGYWAQSYIERLYAAGITGGCGVNPLRYCPEGVVTRAQMAVFLLRGIHGSAYAPPAVGSSTGFGDVATNYWAAPFIKQLAAEGITSGCGNGNFCPEGPVDRAQMAVFLLRAKHGASYTPPPVGATTGFGDVPTNHWAAAFIKQLVAEGITVGCGSGNYCPEGPVTRAQMAVFLVRTFDLP